MNIFKGFINYKMLFVTKVFIGLLLLPFFSESQSLFYNHYESAALNLIKGNGFTINDNQSLIPLTLYPPGYSVFIYLIYNVIGRSILAIRLSQILLSSLATILFIDSFRILNNNKNTAIQFGYFLILNPLFWAVDLSVNTGTSLAISFMMMAIYLLVQTIKVRKIMYACLTGLLITVASTIRTEFILVVTLFLLFIIINFIKSSKIYISYSVCVFIILLPLSIRNYNNFGVINPFPGGTGLAMVNVIGKFNPDYKTGFAFGDAEILKAEGGRYNKLTYPKPYQRDHDRVMRSLNFIILNPLEYIGILFKNLPRAWFGQKLNLLGDNDISLQSHISKSGSIKDFIIRYPLNYLDISLGFIISLMMFTLTIYSFYFFKTDLLKKYYILLLPAVAFFLIFVPLGTLGRYTIPGYILISPLSYLGFKILYGKIRGLKK